MTTLSFVPCARKIGIDGESAPGVFVVSSARQGGKFAKSFSFRKLCASMREGPRRLKTSKNLSMHIAANSSIAGTASGVTTCNIGASYTRDHDQSVIAVMLLPPGVPRSRLNRLRSSVAGAAAATPTSRSSGAYSFAETRKQYGLTALRMAPDGESAPPACARHRPRRSDGIQNRASFAHTDEVGMRPWRSEARIIRSGDGIALRQHPSQALDRLEQNARQRGRAGPGYASGRVSPCDDGPTARRWRTVGDDDDSRNRDRFAAQPFRSIQDPICGSAVWSSPHRLRPNQGSVRIIPEFRTGNRIEVGLSAGRRDTRRRQRRGGERCHNREEEATATHGSGAMSGSSVGSSERELHMDSVQSLTSRFE